MKNWLQILKFYDRNMIFEVETAIKEKLEEISNFAVVYDHFTLNTTWYPYASFELSNFAWQYLDSCSNERDISFNIMIIQNIEKNIIERSAAKNIVYKCLEKVIEKFDWDQDLWEWTIVRGRVTSWEMWTFIEKEWSILALSVQITLTILTSAA